MIPVGQPAAKLGDKVTGVDIHIIMIPTPGGPVPTPLPHPFSGTLTQATSTNVNIEKKPAATVDSIALNMPPHIPQGGPFQKPPSNQGKVMMGSATVLINGKPVARSGDMVKECNDPVDSPTGSIIAVSQVLIGGPPSPTGMPGAGGAQVSEQKFTRQESPPTTKKEEEKGKQKKEGKGSLVITCLDTDGEPVPDCDYEMLFPDGRRKKGKTDSEGKIIEENVTPGDCEIKLHPK